MYFKSDRSQRRLSMSWFPPLHTASASLTLHPSSSPLSIFQQFWSFVTKTRVSMLANEFYKGAIFVYSPHFCYLIIYHSVFEKASLNHSLPVFNHVFVQMWPGQRVPCSQINFISVYFSSIATTSVTWSYIIHCYSNCVESLFWSNVTKILQLVCF